MAHPISTAGRANMSASMASPSPISRRPRGVRRRREDTIEIEELDSEVMRQNTYNYFQVHGRHIGFADTGSSRNNISDHNASSSGDGAANPTRKRQRTLAEQLEQLCLHPQDGAAQSRSSPGISAAAACRQAWTRIISSQLTVQKPHAAAAAASNSNNSNNSSASVQDVDMESSTPVQSSAAEDADLEDAADEDEDDAHESSGGIKIFGGVPDVKGMFFGTGSRQRPMERMFRHYVSMAAERSARGESTTTRDDEVVLFQPGPTSLDFPYSLFTPEQIEDLRARHNRKKKRQATQDKISRSLFSSGGSGAASSSGNEYSWRFQELDSSDEADVSSSAEDSDMDMSNDEASRAPQLAGSLTHGEWFVEDDDDDNDDDDTDDIDSDL